jgi:hypothetical protein
MIFIAMIYISGIFDYGETIDDYITINEDGIQLAEDLGVSLVEYDHRIDNILNNMLNTIDKRSFDNVISYSLTLNDNMLINDIYPYLNKIKASNDPINRHNILGNLEYTTGKIYGYYNSRKLAKNMNKEWRPYKDLQQSYIDENDINVMLKIFMPKILSMAGTDIPNNIEFSGNSLIVSRSPFGPQNFHQDIDELAILSSSTADHEYRIMLFDRDERYDTSWTHIAIDIDDTKANKFVKRNIRKYDFAKLIDFDINKSKYIALIFDNNKVFHRTPPTVFWDWVIGNIPEKRRVTQFRISWDDYDQLNYQDEFNEERFQEIMNGDEWWWLLYLLIIY